MNQYINHLKNLPDGIFICEEGIFQIVNGTVVKLEAGAPPSASSQIITNDDDPKAGGN